MRVDCDILDDVAFSLERVYGLSFWLRYQRLYFRLVSATHRCYIL